MPVVINEFEVVVQEIVPPRERRREESVPAPRAEDVAAVIERQARMRARLVAH